MNRIRHSLVSVFASFCICFPLLAQYPNGAYQSGGITILKETSSGLESSYLSNQELYNRIQKAVQDAERRAQKQQEAARSQSRKQEIELKNAAIREKNRQIEEENRRIEEEARRQREEEARKIRAERQAQTFNNEIARTQAEYSRDRNEVYSMAAGSSHDEVDNSLSMMNIIANDMNQKLSHGQKNKQEEVQIVDLASMIRSKRQAANMPSQSTQEAQDSLFFKENQRMLALLHSRAASSLIPERTIVVPVLFTGATIKQEGLSIVNETMETTGYFSNGVIKESGKQMVQVSLEENNSVGSLFSLGYGMYKKAKDAFDIAKAETSIMERSLSAIKKTVVTGDTKYIDAVFPYAFRRTGDLAADKAASIGFFRDCDPSNTAVKWWAKSLFYKKGE